MGASIPGRAPSLRRVLLTKTNEIRARLFGCLGASQQACVFGNVVLAVSRMEEKNISKAKRIENDLHMGLHPCHTRLRPTSTVVDIADGGGGVTVPPLD
jgi:hypothetical protein